jgi:hypothetical protein
MFSRGKTFLSWSNVRFEPPTKKIQESNRYHTAALALTRAVAKYLIQPNSATEDMAGKLKRMGTATFMVLP